MERTEKYTYKERIEKMLKFRSFDIRISKYDIMSRIIGFFLAMAMPLPGIAPFGMAYLAQERKLSWQSVLSFAAISLGSLAVCDRLGSAKYISAGILYLGILFILEKGVVIKDITAGIIAGVCILVTGVATLFVQGASVTGVVLLLCETAVVVSGSLMMEKSIDIFKNRRVVRDALDSDTKLSLVAVILVALLSLREIYLGSALSVMNVVATVMLLVVSCGCGVGYSTGAGILLGVVCGMGSDFFMPMLGAFGFCGFVAGIFSKFGKTGTTAGIILANGIMAVYTNSALEAMLTLYEILCGAIIFACIPKSFIEGIGYVLCLDEGERKEIAKLKENIKGKISSVSCAFESISKSIDKLATKESGSRDTDVAVIFDGTADKVCSKCRKSTICWGKKFNATYNEMFALLGVLKEKGTLKPEDVSKSFSSECQNIKTFIDELNHQFDVYRVRQVWQSKLTESHKLVGKQMGGISEILNNLTKEMDENTRKSAISAWEIKSRLEISGIKPRDVNVMEDKYGRCRVEILLKSGNCQGKQRRVIEKVVKSMAGCNVIHKEEFSQNKKFIRLIFTEAEKYTVETDYATASAKDKNGDNFRFMHLKSGKFIIAVSDGMGTGSRAAKESKAILELLDSFLEAGFDGKAAVKLINSIMIMKSDDEAFVTLDLCIIDLYTGRVKFIKTGAEPSFISSGNGRVRTICSAALPVGIIADAEADISDTKVKSGDNIVMITDGIENRENGSLWVKRYIEENGHKEKLKANEILNRAMEKSGGTVKDDMTVLSVKVKSVS